MGGLAPALLPTAGSPRGVLLQAEASGHVHHIMWVLRTPVAQGDLGERRRESHSPGQCLPPHPSQEIPLGLLVS